MTSLSACAGTGKLGARELLKLTQTCLYVAEAVRGNPSVLYPTNQIIVHQIIKSKHRFGAPQNNSLDHIRN